MISNRLASVMALVDEVVFQRMDRQLQRVGKMNPFVTFMASPAGRITRIAAGALLLGYGLLVLGGVLGWVIAVVGLVPLLSDLFDFCVFAPLFGAPLSAPKIGAR